MFGSFEITSIRLYTPLRNPLHGLHGVYNLIEVISSWTKQKLRSILKYCKIMTVSVIKREYSYIWYHGIRLSLLSLPFLFYKVLTQIQMICQLLSFVKSQMCIYKFILDLIDWLVFNTNFSSTSAISWCEQILTWSLTFISRTLSLTWRLWLIF